MAVGLPDGGNVCIHLASDSWTD